MTVNDYKLLHKYNNQCWKRKCRDCFKHSRQTRLPSAAILQTGLLQPALTGIIGLRSTHPSPESVLNYKVKVIPATSVKSIGKILIFLSLEIIMEWTLLCPGSLSVQSTPAWGLSFSCDCIFRFIAFFVASSFFYWKKSKVSTVSPAVPLSSILATGEKLPIATGKKTSSSWEAEHRASQNLGHAWKARLTLNHLNNNGVFILKLSHRAALLMCDSFTGRCRA